MAIHAHIVHPTDVNRWLSQQETKRNAPLLMRFAFLLEKAEHWAIDDISTDSEGTPLGVNDARGTAAERLQALSAFQDVINSAAFASYLREHAGDPRLSEVDRRLIELLAMIKSSRFIVCLHHMSNLSPEYVASWLEKVDACARQGEVLAHVLRERVTMLHRAHLVATIFSREAALQVRRTLAKLNLAPPAGGLPPARGDAGDSQTDAEEST